MTWQQHGEDAFPFTSIQQIGDLINCANYRGITILSIPGKVLNRIILHRIKELVIIQLHWASQRIDPVLTEILCDHRARMEEDAVNFYLASSNLGFGHLDLSASTIKVTWHYSTIPINRWMRI